MTTVIQITTPHDHTVNVTANPNDPNRPYRWTCTAGHASESPYASLPFARNDAQAHADTCPGSALPSTERRPVPDSSHRDYCAHHDAVYADPRLTSLDTAARYHGEHSHDEGATWTLLRVPHFYDTVCGGHVQCEVAGALQSGWDVTADGTTRLIREWDGALTRWTLTVLTDEETATMEEMLRQSRARAR